MKKKQKEKYIILSTIIVLILVMAIAFAALSSTLKINTGKLTQSAQSWNVGFVANNALGATASGTSATGRSCGTAVVTATSVTVGAVSISKPGDECLYKLDIKNSGSINAKLTSISAQAASGMTCTYAGNDSSVMVCKNIRYKITSTSNTNGQNLRDEYNGKEYLINAG